MGTKTNIMLFGVLTILIFSPFYMPYYLSCNSIETVDYNLEETNEIWNQYEEHNYVKRTTPNSNSIVIADNLINNNQVFLLRYWEPFIFNENELDWSEDPYDDWTWLFYFHSLRMVSYLVNAYELSDNVTYLEKAQWFIESWAEHNPCSKQQASPRAWDDHSTANRITTFIYFWDHYRNSEIFDNNFANQFLNLLRLHGEYTAIDSNYMWGHNHGIFQDIALMQLAFLFPNFEKSDEWLDIGKTRFSIQVEDGVTLSGVHKEHSPAYHYMVLNLFLGMSQFNNHYNIVDEELDSIVYKMQEYLVHIVKPDGTVPLVGDSNAVNALGISESKITNEHLLYLVSDGSEGQKIDETSFVYQDAGVAIFKNDWENSNPLYFALFNGFHSSVHKQSDDLSFVLTYNQTDYFVDSGKYNFVEHDPYRVFVRSVFAHNTVAVDDETYDYKDPDNVGKTVIENYVITQNYSFVKASHELYQGVKVTRSVIFFNDGAIYIHDELASDEAHKYTQMFNIGDDVDLDLNNTSEILLSSKKDNGSLTLKQLNSFNKFKTYTGSNDPTRGWQSTIFNEVSPITTLNFEVEGESAVFETVINIELNITDVEIFQEGDKDIFVLKFNDNRTETIEINTSDEISLSQNEDDGTWRGLLFLILLLMILGVSISVNKKEQN